MIQFYNAADDSSFSLSDREFALLNPVFVIFRNKTGLEIGEYKDVRLIPANLALISTILADYRRGRTDRRELEVLEKFDLHIKRMIQDGNLIWVSGE